MSVSPDPQPEQSHRTRNVLLAVAAVLLAVAIPVIVILLMPDNGATSDQGSSSKTKTSSTPPETSKTASTPTSTSTGFVVIGEVVLDPANAPNDAAPDVYYALKGKVYTAEGTVPLPLEKADRLWAFVPHGDGWMIVAYRPKIDETVARVVDGTGYVSAEWLAGGVTPAAGWDGSSAYVVADAVQVDGPDGVTIQGWPLPNKGNYWPVGILPDGSLVLNDKARGRVEIGVPLTELAVVPGIIAVGGVSETGQVTTLDKIKDAGSCGSLREDLYADPSWSTCHYTLGRFNPSGSLVIGYPDYRDGIGDYRVSILDAADGTAYVDFTAKSSGKSFTFINSVVWEDDTHLLAQVYNSDTGWRILRLGVDGKVTTADVGPLSGGELNAPVTFVTKP